MIFVILLIYIHIFKNIVIFQNSFYTTSKIRFIFIFGILVNCLNLIETQMKHLLIITTVITP
jgi:hypothetical protein